MKIKSQPTGVSTFESRTRPSTDQSLQKRFHLSHADKIVLEKISFPSENKKYSTLNRHSNTITQQRQLFSDKVDRRPAYNRRLAKLAVQCLNEFLFLLIVLFEVAKWCRASILSDW